ncbi:hypothetical protein AURDEDRAFT_184853 [Auricularia subglabra TFB-10046 SS5]|nr:hypothetical protein AURDEDRAFT_184853 [Auricularia subglabra TFB-10046 SS5]
MPDQHPVENSVCLLDLPRDVLLAICDHLELQLPFEITTVPRFERHEGTGFHEWYDSGSELLWLSMTCRRFRQLCAPIIFRVCVLERISENRDVPSSAAVFTRRLYIREVQMTASHFRDFLRNFPNLREAYVTDSPHLLPALLTTQSLEVLALQNVLMSHPLHLFTAVSSPLRTLRVLSSKRLLSADDNTQSTLVESDWLRSLLPRVRETLVELFIPAESTSISCLCAAPWPMLRELVIVGGLRQQDVPLLRLLAMLPRLQALTLAVIYPRDMPRVLVWPPGTHYHVDLSGLRRLTLSSASDADHLFAHLPPTLEELSLRDTPRTYLQNRLSPQRALAAYDLRILTCKAALTIFRQLETACLWRLELVVLEDSRELDLLSHLAAACPSLVSFELHTYRDISDVHALWNNPPSITMTELATALSSFRALRILRLNIEHPLSQIMFTGRPSIDASARFGENIARTVVRRVPWLHTIGVFGVMDMGIKGWKVWAVAERDGAVDLDLHAHVWDR